MRAGHPTKKGSPPGGDVPEGQGQLKAPPVETVEPNGTSNQYLRSQPTGHTMMSSSMNATQGNQIDLVFAMDARAR